MEVTWLPADLSDADAAAAARGVLGECVLGIASAPGWNGANVEEDFRTASAAGARWVLSLVEDDDLWFYGIAQRSGGPNGFVLAAERAGLRMVRHPVVDMAVPASLEAWCDVVADAAAALQRGEGGFVHCGGGIGRSGMAAACVLAGCGMSPAEAVRIVRSSDPRRIATTGQLAWVERTAHALRRRVAPGV